MVSTIHIADEIHPWKFGFHFDNIVDGVRHVGERDGEFVPPIVGQRQRILFGTVKFACSIDFIRNHKFECDVSQMGVIACKQRFRHEPDACGALAFVRLDDATDIFVQKLIMRGVASETT
jgi:hypothetical protein